MNCRHCGEELDQDIVPLNDAQDWLHRPCLIRLVTGSEDCLRRGPHRPGTCRPDDPRLSRRAAALAAYRAWLELGGHGTPHGNTLPGGDAEEWPEVIEG